MRANRMSKGRERLVAVAAAAAVGLAVAPPATAATSAPSRPAGLRRGHLQLGHLQLGHLRLGHLRLGRLRLGECAAKPLAYCGHIRVPLDYSAASSPLITIGLRWIPATGTAASTVLAVEGGPGYASTGTQHEYLAMLGPLRSTRNLLMVDLRGTGTSTPVDCPGLERFAGAGQYGRRFDALVAACGRELDHTWRYRSGRWVHAADLFNTANSARDVARVLADLRLPRVDLYGDSYGSWFAQAFASRYPGLLRSVTLDSTYQVLRLDPWYVTTVVTARRAFDAACARWPACARSARRQGAGWAEITALARRLATAPVTGNTTMPNGKPGRLTVSLLTLVNLVNNAGFDPVVYRDLYAAARALLRDHDPAPLLRTAALSIGFDDGNYSLPEFSDGLFFAVSCTDYGQLFRRTAAPAIRRGQYAAALRREPRGTFAPFTVAQWTSMDQYTEAYSACLDWPRPARLTPPITRRPPLVPARLPVLVMSGDLDSLTPLLHGASLVARQLGPSARLVVFRNLTHVMLQDANDACPASVFQRFIADPGNLRSKDVSCAARVTPIHAVASYPVLLRDAARATPRRGNKAGPQALRAVTIALAAVGDEFSRWAELSGRRDLGLRGGTVTFAAGVPPMMTFRGVRWVRDATISGHAGWNQRTGWAAAALVVRPAHGKPVHIEASWNVFAAPDRPVPVAGYQGAARLLATTPAP